MSQDADLACGPLTFFATDLHTVASATTSLQAGIENNAAAPKIHWWQLYWYAFLCAAQTTAKEHGPSAWW